MDLINIYFNANSTRSNFAVLYDPVAIGTDVARTSYTFIVMSKTDWQAIPDATRSALEQRYNLLEDNKGCRFFCKPNDSWRDSLSCKRCTRERHPPVIISSTLPDSFRRSSLCLFPERMEKGQRQLPIWMSLTPEEEHV